MLIRALSGEAWIRDHYILSDTTAKSFDKDTRCTLLALSADRQFLLDLLWLRVVRWLHNVGTSRGISRSAFSHFQVIKRCV